MVRGAQTLPGFPWSAPLIGSGMFGYRGGDFLQETIHFCSPITGDFLIIKTSSNTETGFWW